jgi:hypothetical protein
MTEMDQLVFAMQHATVKFVKLFSGIPPNTRWYRMRIPGSALASVRIVRWRLLLYCSLACSC